MAEQTVTIKLELNIGEGLRSTLVALGWTPPGEQPPPLVPAIAIASVATVSARAPIVVAA